MRRTSDEDDRLQEIREKAGAGRDGVSGITAHGWSQEHLHLGEITLCLEIELGGKTRGPVLDLDDRRIPVKEADREDPVHLLVERIGLRPLKNPLELTIDLDDLLLFIDVDEVVHDEPALCVMSRLVIRRLGHGFHRRPDLIIRLAGERMMRRTAGKQQSQHADEQSMHHR